MCDPATAMMAFSAVAGGASFFSQKEQAEAQSDAIEANYASQMAANAEQLQELNSSAATEKSDLAREALARKGQVRVASGESGLGGLVVDSLLQDVDAQSGRAVSRVEEDRRRGANQIRRNGESIYANNQSNMNAVKRPSAVATLAGIGSDVFAIQATRPSKKTTPKPPTPPKRNPRNVAQNGGR